MSITVTYIIQLRGGWLLSCPAPMTRGRAQSSLPRSEGGIEVSKPSQREVGKDEPDLYSQKSLIHASREWVNETDTRLPGDF